jgi:hypothetical protein
MSTYIELSKKLENLQSQLNFTLSEIENVKLEQKKILDEKSNAFQNEVKQIVENLKTHFKAYDKSIDLNISLSFEDNTISIMKPQSFLSYHDFNYEGKSIEDIKKWAQLQIKSLQFYRYFRNSFHDFIEISANAEKNEHFSITKSFNSKTRIYPTYDPKSNIVTLTIKKVVNVQEINNRFTNIQVIDEDEYIIETIKSRTCYLNEMIKEIKSELN